MKYIYILVPLFFFNFLFSWESQDFKLGTPINCDYFKNNTPNDTNPNLQKCLIFEKTFNKYEKFANHYLEKNKLGEKYDLKVINIYAEYKYKKFIYENMNKDDKILLNKFKWESISLKNVLDHIEISKPSIIKEYETKVAGWFSNGEGKELSNEHLLDLHTNIIKNLNKAINMKYQFRINGNYTSLIEIQKELSKRGLLYNTIDLDSKF